MCDPKEKPVMGRLQGFENLSIDLKKKIIDMVDNGLTQTKVAAC